MVSGGGVWAWVSVGVVHAVWTTLVGVHWHQVLHVLGLFLSFLAANTTGRRQEHDGSDQQLTDANPGSDVGPAIVKFGHTRVFEHLRKTTENGQLYLVTFCRHACLRLARKNMNIHPSICGGRRIELHATVPLLPRTSKLQANKAMSKCIIE